MWCMLCSDRNKERNSKEGWFWYEFRCVKLWLLLARSLDWTDETCMFNRLSSKIRLHPIVEIRTRFVPLVGSDIASLVLNIATWQTSQRYILFLWARQFLYLHVQNTRERAKVHGRTTINPPSMDLGEWCNRNTATNHSGTTGVRYTCLYLLVHCDA